MVIRNSIANFLAYLVYPTLSIFLVPFYIHYLGLEGYGLIGFFSTLVILLTVFTKGLSLSLQREIARRMTSDEDHQTLRRLVRTFELVYWAMGAVLVIVSVLLSIVISNNWLQVASFPQSTVRICMLLILLRITVAFPNSVYQAVFVGTQQQVLGNLINIVSSLVEALMGAAVVFIWRSVIGFYLMGVLTAGGGLILLRYWARQMLPAKEVSLVEQFEWVDLKKLWRVSTGLIWTDGIRQLITYLDRVVISRVLPIANLGVYTAGTAGGHLISTVCNPFLVAAYPQVCQIAKSGTKAELSAYLVRNAKVIMIICMSFGLPISFFSAEILEIWTRNAEVIKNGTLVMSLYIYGSILFYYAWVFYQGQMALGKSRYGVLVNTCALIWFPLALWFLVKSSGLSGAAMAWLLYGGFSWLVHTAVISVILLKRKHLVEYIRLLALTISVGAAFSYIARNLATYYFPYDIWGRVLIAGIGIVLTFMVCYIICFGFRVPDEVVELLSRSRLTEFRNRARKSRVRIISTGNEVIDYGTTSELTTEIGHNHQVDLGPGKVKAKYKLPKSAV